jgi:DNA-binding transcriptional LysR family regulator
MIRIDMIDKMHGSTVEQLRAFAAVAAHEHVTQAARYLGLSQPTVSHQLKALQGALGLALLERVGRGVRLSEDGRALLPAVTAALAALRSVEEAAAARCGLAAGSLALAASNTTGIYRLPAWMAGFVERYPGVDVRVQLVNTVEAIHLLRAGEVDCAFIEAPGPTEGLEELAVESDELVVVAAPSHPLVARRHVGAAELRRHRYLAREPGSGTEALAAELLRDAYRRGPVLELGQVDAVRSAAVAGLGYAVLPLAAVAGDLEAGRLRRLPTGRPGLTRTLRALRRPAGSSPALQSFWAHLFTVSTIESPPPSPLGVPA